MKTTDQEVIKLALLYFFPLSRLKSIFKSKPNLKTLKKNLHTWLYIPTTIHAVI